MSSRTCYRIELELRSALSIGAADSDVTDCDVLLDSRGLPIIPGTSLAGAFRSLFYDKDAEEGVRDKDCIRIFGELDAEGADESAVRIYDAQLVLPPDTTGVGGTPVEGGEDEDRPAYNTSVSVRDGVKLIPGQKIAEPKKKFDRQVVEPGAVFLAFLEVLNERRCTAEDAERMVFALHSGELALGSRTTRGYGRVRVVRCWKRHFDLSDERDIDEWVEFDMFDESDPRWHDAAAQDLTPALKERDAQAPFCRSDELVLRLHLKLRGGMDVREHETQAGAEDYGQLVAHGLRRDGVDVPVIPGTSWAGALRARYAGLAGSLGGDERALFGVVDEVTGLVHRSAITVGESHIGRGQWKVITRNVIDPLTGGTMDELLFTERAYWGGETTLELRVRDLDSLTGGSGCLRPLVAALADLHSGLLAVGGLTSVGRGLFRIERDEGTLAISRGANVTQDWLASMQLGDLARPDVARAAEVLFGTGIQDGGAA